MRSETGFRFESLGMQRTVQPRWRQPMQSGVALSIDLFLQCLALPAAAAAAAVPAMLIALCACAACQLPCRAQQNRQRST